MTPVARLLFLPCLLLGFSAVSLKAAAEPIALPAQAVSAPVVATTKPAAARPLELSSALANSPPPARLATPGSPLLPSASERAWLDAHPVLRVGVVRQDWRPIDQVDADGRYSGLSAEALARLAEMTGLHYEISVEPNIATLLDKLRRGELDLAPSLARTHSRQAYLLFTEAYIESPTVLIARHDAPELALQGPLWGKRIAVERDRAVHELLPRRYPGAHMLVFENSAEALRAVADARADAYLGALAPAAWVIEKERLAKLTVRAPLAIDGGLRFALAQQAAPLQALLDRAIAAWPPQERSALLQRWTPARLQAPAEPGPLRLDDAERRWLEAHQGVRVGYLIDAAPLAFAGPDGEMRGLFAQQLDTLAQRLGLRIASRRGYRQAALHAALEMREVDIAIGLPRLAERERLAAFAGPLLSLPTVAITRAESSFFHDPADYNGKTLAIKRGHVLIPRLLRHYPGVRVLEFENLGDALEAVARGDAEICLSDFALAGPALANDYAGALKVAGIWADAPSETYLAVRKDWPQLADLFGRALNTLSAAERQSLRQTWLTPQHQFSLPWRRMLLVGLPLVLALALVLGSVLVWNRRLRAEVARRREVERQLVSARDTALEAADRLTLFLGALSHEIRTPMNGVTGLVDALAHSRLDEGQRYQLGVIARSARMALGILGDALDLARAEAGRLSLAPKATDARALAEDVMAMLSPLAAERGLTLQLSIAPHLPLLVFDGLRLRQVLANLLTNALRYTERGYVRLRVTGAPLQKGRWRLVVDVEDSGPGMSESARRTLFKPFAHIGEAGGQGTGLGLAICRAISEAMGANFDLDSAPGAGTRFRFALEADAASPAQAEEPPFIGLVVRLQCADSALRNECAAWLRAWGARPIEAGSNEFSQLTLADTAIPHPGQPIVLLLRELAGGEPHRARDGSVRIPAQPLLPGRLRQAVHSALTPSSAARAAETAPSRSGRRVLVVDDEPLNLRVARELLGLLGFEASLAGESQAGFEAFCSGHFEAVLLDYRMPGEDGVSLAARMRQRERNRKLPATPIVAVTADSSEGTHSACLAAGMDSLMLKPLTLSALHAKLSELGCQPDTPAEGLAPETVLEDDEGNPLEHLAALLGSEERARSIADGFVVASLEDLVGMREKLEIGDLEATRFLAHRIKGGARNAGFDAVGEAAAELEHCARAGNLDGCPQLVVRLTQTLERLRERLAAG